MKTYEDLWSPTAENMKTRKCPPMEPYCWVQHSSHIPESGLELDSVFAARQEHSEMDFSQKIEPWLHELRFCCKAGAEWNGLLPKEWAMAAWAPVLLQSRSTLKMSISKGAREMDDSQMTEPWLHELRSCCKAWAHKKCSFQRGHRRSEFVVCKTRSATHAKHTLGYSFH